MPLIYFSGTHGSGKTTLLHTIKKELGKEAVVSDKLPLKNTDNIMQRNKLRYARFYLQAMMQQRQAEETGKIVLCDRCIYDNLGYINGFKDINWLSPEDFDLYMFFHDKFFDKKLLPENIVYVNPPLEFTQKCIRQRWQEKGKKKWREEDFSYLQAVKKGFDTLYQSLDANVLELTETCLDKRVEKTLTWIEQLKVTA